MTNSKPARQPAGAAELSEHDLASLAAGAVPRGPSGTGKTLSATVVAGLMPEEPIWYIGETEKNIDGQR